MVSPSVPTLYKGIIIDTASGCKGVDSVHLFVTPIVLALPAPVLSNDTSLCIIGDSISVAVAVGNSMYPGAWTYRSEALAFFVDTMNDSTVFKANVGVYTLSWSESNLGCVGSDSMTITVLPLPKVNAGIDSTICAGKFLQLAGQGDAQSFQWIPIDSVVNASDTNTTTLSIFQNSFFILEGLNGLCKSRDTVEIFVIDCPSDIKVPSAFSPNGDGQNDFFSVFTYQMKTYEIWIFNRWGENVYYSNDLAETNWLNKGWDGSFKGTVQEVGTYIYLIKGTNRDDEKVTLKGNLTLVK
jgi:gliding motility-associated-like protein